MVTCGFRSLHALLCPAACLASVCNSVRTQFKSVAVLVQAQTNGKAATSAAKKPLPGKKLQKKPVQNGALPSAKKVKQEKVRKLLWADHSQLLPVDTVLIDCWAIIVHFLLKLC